MRPELTAPKRRSIGKRLGRRTSCCSLSILRFARRRGASMTILTTDKKKLECLASEKVFSRFDCLIPDDSLRREEDERPNSPVGLFREIAGQADDGADDMIVVRDQPAFDLIDRSVTFPLQFH